MIVLIWQNFKPVSHLSSVEKRYTFASNEGIKLYFDMINTQLLQCYYGYSYSKDLVPPI